MSDVRLRLTPEQYSPARLSVQPENGGIVATADFKIYNADGSIQVGDDHPSVVLPVEQPVVLEENQTVTLPAGVRILLIDGPITVRADGPVTATLGIRAALLYWFNEQCALYEVAEDLTRYVPPVDPD